MLFLSFLILVINTFFAVFLPRVFIVIYLFVWTGFLGIVSSETIKPLSFENLIFLLNLVVLVSLIYGMFNKRYFDSKGLILFYIAFFLFGVFYPYIRGFSSILSALTDGKDFLSILFGGYLLQNLNKLPFSYVEKVVYLFSALIGIYIVFYFLLGVSPPGYEPVLPDIRAEGIHVRYSTLVVLAFTLSLIRFYYKRTYNNLMLFFVMFVFLIIQPHKSVYLVTLSLYAGYFIFLSNLKTKILSFAFVFGVFLGFLGTNNLGVIQDVIVKPFTHVVKGEGVIGSRLDMSALRISYWLKEPLFGYGFINEDTKIGISVETASASRFNSTLGIVDAGYIDLLVRFGVIGLAFFVVFYFYWFIKTFNYRNEFYCKIFALFILSYVFVSISWSVMTYVHGIVTLAMLFYFIAAAKYNTFFSGRN